MKCGVLGLFCEDLSFGFTLYSVIWGMCIVECEVRSMESEVYSC